MIKLLNLKPDSFSLDISDFSLRVAQLKKRGKDLVLASFGETNIKPGIIKKGEIRQEKDLVEAIQKTILQVEGEKIKTKYVVCSLPEEKAFLQVIKMPKMSEEDLKSAIVYEAENHIPLPIENVYLDFQIVSSNPNSPQMEVLIAALPKKTVDSYTDSLKKAGLKPFALEVESLAIARALIEKEFVEKPILLIDLGFTRTGFVVFSDSSVEFTSSIQVSSHDFTQIIAKALHLEEKAAENLKIKYGLEGKINFKIKGDKTEKKIERGRVFEALIPALTDLVQQIRKYLDYYQNHISTNKEEVMEKVLLCGGGANLKGLAELLSVELKIPVELGNPLINISSRSGKTMPHLSLEKSLSYTTAIGLALRGMKETKI